MVAWSGRQNGMISASRSHGKQRRARVSRVWRWLFILPLAGCSASSGGGVPTTTTTLLPPLETTTTVLAPTSSTVAAAFAIPAVVDLPYVQRVLETIYHLEGEATRHAYAMRGPDAESDERLVAILGNPSLANTKKILRDNAADGFRVFADPPGDARVRAVEIIQAASTCMVIRADLDFGPQFKEYRPPQPQSVIQLERAEVLPYNPTGWGVVVAGAPNPGQDLRVCS